MARHEAVHLYLHRERVSRALPWGGGQAGTARHCATGPIAGRYPGRVASRRGDRHLRRRPPPRGPCLSIATGRPVARARSGDGRSRVRGSEGRGAHDRVGHWGHRHPSRVIARGATAIVEAASRRRELRTGTIGFLSGSPGRARPVQGREGELSHLRWPFGTGRIRHLARLALHARQAVASRAGDAGRRGLLRWRPLLPRDLPIAGAASSIVQPEFIS